VRRRWRRKNNAPAARRAEAAARRHFAPHGRSVEAALGAAAYLVYWAASRARAKWSDTATLPVEDDPLSEVVVPVVTATREERAAAKQAAAEAAGNVGATGGGPSGPDMSKDKPGGKGIFEDAAESDQPLYDAYLDSSPGVGGVIGGAVGGALLGPAGAVAGAKVGAAGVEATNKVIDKVKDRIEAKRGGK
jgi:hypothetical protein